MGLIDEATTTRLYLRSGATRWQVSQEDFRTALERSLAHRFPSPPSARDAAAYLDTLHVDDLGLACGCRAGDDAAWEWFIRELRPALYVAARTIAGDDGRELADSLYADLFGLLGADGERRSLLLYFHGRSRLITWLRSVLAQRQIDRHRARQRFSSLDDPDMAVQHELAAPPAADPQRREYLELAQQALDSAIDALDPRDRLRLRLYYGQDLTLAGIGRTVREHEATVSRKIDRSRKAIRAHVERALAARGLDRAAVQLCFEYAAGAPELQLDRLLASAEDG